MDRIIENERVLKFAIDEEVTFCSLEGGGRLEGKGVIKGWTHPKRGKKGLRYRVRTDMGDVMIPEGDIIRLH